jgi:hypothetical protein
MAALTMAMIGAKEAAGVAEAAIGILTDYMASLREPDAEVIAAWQRIAAKVSEGNAIVQAIEPVQFIPSPDADR